MRSPSHSLKRLSDGAFRCDEKVVKEEIATKLGQPLDDIENNLFNDVMEFHKLASFEGYSNAKELLNRYSVAHTF
jgi:predicted nuclease of restriction endonuclease-like RecB superfamily